MRFLFWLTEAPDTSGHARVAFELAKAAVAKGHAATLFLLDDAVYAASAAPLQGLGHQGGGLTAELAAWRREVGPERAEVLACTLSCEERGLAAPDLWPGAEISSSAVLGRLLKAADRTLAFIP